MIKNALICYIRSKQCLKHVLNHSYILLTNPDDLEYDKENNFLAFRENSAHTVHNSVNFAGMSDSVFFLKK